MRSFTVGFAFGGSLSKVLLLEKNRPSWQVGQWNGLGGRIEPGEKPVDAMVREFEEEAKLKTEAWEWRPVARLHEKFDPDYEIHVFAIDLDKKTGREFDLDKRFQSKSGPAFQSGSPGEVCRVWRCTDALVHPKLLPDAKWLLVLSAAALKGLEKYVTIERKSA